ncbi:MAG: hypothetical protein FJX55_11865 [Alphaproteobacteria bacterium]|nr:hypothetical protein [Alphaproteobacteria bacterium]
MAKATGQISPEFIALIEQMNKHVMELQYGCYAFNAAGLSSSGAHGVTSVVRYDTRDSFTTVQAAGYFNSYAGTLQTGDTLEVFSTANVDGGFRAYQVSVSGAGVVTLTRHEAPRVSVQYFVTGGQLALGTVQYLRSPVRGRVADHRCVVQATDTSGGTLTVGVAGSPAMSGGVITVSNGAAPGTPFDSTPIAKNAANVITTGGVITVAPAGFTGDGTIAGEILIDPTR